MRRLPAIAALLIVAGSGCGSPTEPHRAVLSLLRQAEAIWADSALTSYSIVQERFCECLPSEIGPVRLTVAVGGGAVNAETIVSAVYVEGGEPVAAGHSFLSVRQLFELIREAARTNADVIEVGFNAIYGYPSDVLIDYDRAIADDERVYTTYDLQNLAEAAAVGAP
ncbi:MAG TPA: DUF6174 domain-containing protein [Longimicrobiales bacterium]|nr:DUF6174 domain-containing protein [Longimicrobiales bacterium]